MNILFKLTDKDFGIEPQETKDYRLRVAARGIVVRDDGKIAIQNKSNKNEYKLVGGGMEENEDPIIAFKREVLEEAGCEIEIIKQLGITEEYKSLQNLKQISNIFIAKVINDTHKLNLTEKEKSEGAKLLWVEPKEALKLVTDCYDKLLPSDYDDVYDTRFVVLRDRKILEYYLGNIK
ncbi:MAG: NUDIX domain-containing protein [Clostridia bacterium]|jgi:8-oxo-dGTP diphosphatase|nr:NUDIX domain-containing protein [Clostridia bacterium]